jgi:hypothetical protein
MPLTINLTGVNTIVAAQNSADKYAVATGTDTYAITLSPAPTAYATGQTFWVKIANTNATSTPTLNVNGLGAKNIVASNAVAIPIGQFVANGNYALLYDGTNFVLQANIMDRKDISYYRKTGTATLERWYSSAIVPFTASTIALAKDQQRAMPFIVSKTITLDRIASEITIAGSAGSLVRLGIYDDVNGIPTNLISDAGTIAGDSATFQSITINQTLSPGLYHLVSFHNSSSSITFRTIPSTSVSPVYGIPSTLGATTLAGTISATQTYGAMPNPFSTTAIAIQSSASVQLISVRLSA